MLSTLTIISIFTEIFAAGILLSGGLTFIRVSWLTKKTKDLSKGMKVKLSFALALAHDPDLLILDEPTSGLDPVIRRELLDLLRGVCRDQGKSVLMETHFWARISSASGRPRLYINCEARLAAT